MESTIDTILFVVMILVFSIGCMIFINKEADKIDKNAIDEENKPCLECKHTECPFRLNRKALKSNSTPGHEQKCYKDFDFDE